LPTHASKQVEGKPTVAWAVLANGKGLIKRLNLRRQIDSLLRNKPGQPVTKQGRRHEVPIASEDRSRLTVKTVLGVQQRKTHESIKAYPWVFTEKRLQSHLHRQDPTPLGVRALHRKPGLQEGDEDAFAG
jgi:hypothetical protein